MSSISPLDGSAERAGPFRIETEPDRDRVIVAPHGELDIDTVPAVADEIDGLAVIDGPELVSRVFDLAGVRDALAFETTL